MLSVEDPRITRPWVQLATVRFEMYAPLPSSTSIAVGAFNTIRSLRVTFWHPSMSTAKDEDVSTMHLRTLTFFASSNLSPFPVSMTVRLVIDTLEQRTMRRPSFPFLKRHPPISRSSVSTMLRSVPESMNWPLRIVTSEQLTIQTPCSVPATMQSSISNPSIPVAYMPSIEVDMVRSNNLTILEELRNIP